MTHCPDCIEPLKTSRKKLGYLTRWLQCPKCGFLTRPELRPLDTNFEEKRIKLNSHNTESHYDG